MKKYILIIGFIVLYSCGSEIPEYFQKETEIVTRKIDYSMFEIQTKMDLNPGMATPFYDISVYLKSNLDSLIQFIEEEKTEKTQMKLAELSEVIDSYSYFDSNYIKGVLIPGRLKKLTDDLSAPNGQNDKQILKLDVLDLECELLSYLHNSMEADYYKFNKLQAVVLDSSDHIKVGETYHASIFLAAFDTTRCPAIMVADCSQPDSILQLDRPDNERIFYIGVIDGKGDYKVKVNKTGIHGFKGVIKFPNSDGEMEKFMFSKEFVVRK